MRGKGAPKMKRQGASTRTPLMVRTTPQQGTQLANVRRRREFSTQQQAASVVLSAGLRAVALQDAAELYRNGRSLDEAAREVGLPVGEVFEHFLRERIPLMENEDALNSLARLARRYHLPTLERVVAEIQQELAPPPV